MTDPSSGSNPGVQPNPGSGPPPVPRWVKVTGIVVVVLALLVVVMLLLGHGPGRHGAPGAAAGQTFPASAAMILAGFGDCR
jgi:hypothetical protein